MGNNSDEKDPSKSVSVSVPISKNDMKSESSSKDNNNNRGEGRGGRSKSPKVSLWNAERDSLLIGSCPHSWLFDRVGAVVHHGGAGERRKQKRNYFQCVNVVLKCFLVLRCVVLFT